MKQYFTGFFTGACLVVSAVMFMGASESNSKIGKYQGFGIGNGNARYIIDTETGKMWFHGSTASSSQTGWNPMESTFKKY